MGYDTLEEAAQRMSHLRRGYPRAFLAIDEKGYYQVSHSKAKLKEHILLATMTKDGLEFEGSRLSDSEQDKLSKLIY